MPALPAMNRVYRTEMMNDESMISDSKLAKQELGATCAECQW